MLWIDNWDKQWKIIKDQHLKATGNVINLTDTEIRKLKFTSLPSDVASTLEKADKDLFPNITFLLCLLGVLPLTTCEAECSVSPLQ